MTWSWTMTLVCRPASMRSRVRRMSLAWGGVAGGVVVDDDDGGGAERDGAANDFADVNRGLVDRAAPHRFVGEQHVAGVEEQHAHFFDAAMGHGGLEIVAERLPARQHRPSFHAGLEQAQASYLAMSKALIVTSLNPSRLSASALARVVGRCSRTAR